MGMKGGGHAWLCMAMRGWEEGVQRTRMGTRIAEVAGMVWVQCSHVQLCRGGEILEALNAMIKHQTQVRIQPLAGKKNQQSCRKQKQSKHFLGSWIPTTNHKIRLTEDLTWIFHYVTFLSLVWTSPALSLLFLQASPPPIAPETPFSFSLFSSVCLFLSKPSCLLLHVPSGGYPSSSLAAREQPTWEAVRKPQKIIIIKKAQAPRGGGLQICPSSVEFTSTRNMNTEMKRKCE